MSLARLATTGAVTGPRSRRPNLWRRFLHLLRR